MIHIRGYNKKNDRRELNGKEEEREWSEWKRKQVIKKNEINRKNSLEEIHKKNKNNPVPV